MRPASQFEVPPVSVDAKELQLAKQLIDQQTVAIQLYLQAIAADDQAADAHFNVSRLYEEMGDMQSAIRHMACYRRLSRPS